MFCCTWFLCSLTIFCFGITFGYKWFLCSIIILELHFAENDFSSITNFCFGITFCWKWFQHYIQCTYRLAGFANWVSSSVALTKRVTRSNIFNISAISDPQTDWRLPRKQLKDFLISSPFCEDVSTKRIFQIQHD